MVRWLLLMLMFALPAQFVWAASASYCAHEGDSAPFHVGHHSHKHEGVFEGASEVPQSQDEIYLQANEDPDCSYCQLLPEQHGQSLAHIATAVTSSSAPRSALRLYGVGIDRDIYRPKWISATYLARTVLTN